MTAGPSMFDHKAPVGIQAPHHASLSSFASVTPQEHFIRPKDVYVPLQGVPRLYSPVAPKLKKKNTRSPTRPQPSWNNSITPKNNGNEQSSPRRSFVPKASKMTQPNRHS
tara:strand:+ start:241 stop:570 length:330 start_codon:yes stop_codon:yes gene_type:complete